MKVGFSRNQDTYQDCIRWLICQLKLRNKFSKDILMQDGATPHTALSTRTFLRQQFKDWIIGKHFTKEWLALSPDLTPADYYFTTDIIYHTIYIYVNNVDILYYIY